MRRLILVGQVARYQSEGRLALEAWHPKTEHPERGLRAGSCQLCAGSGQDRAKLGSRRNFECPQGSDLECP